MKSPNVMFVNKIIQLIIYSIFLIGSLLYTGCSGRQLNLEGESFVNDQLCGIRFDNRKAYLFQWESYEFDYQVIEDVLILSTSSFPCKDSVLCKYLFELKYNEPIDLVLNPLNRKSNLLFLNERKKFKSKAHLIKSEYDSISISIVVEHLDRDDLIGNIIIYSGGFFTARTLKYPKGISGKIKKDFPNINYNHLETELGWINREQFNVDNLSDSHPLLFNLCKFSENDKFCFMGYDFPNIYSELDKLLNELLG